MRGNWDVWYWGEIDLFGGTGVTELDGAVFGLYQESDTWLYVNRGIGMEGGHAPRVRFMARPEVTVIDLAR